MHWNEQAHMLQNSMRDTLQKKRAADQAFCGAGENIESEDAVSESDFEAHEMQRDPEDAKVQEPRASADEHNTEWVTVTHEAFCQWSISDPLGFYPDYCSSDGPFNDDIRAAIVE